MRGLCLFLLLLFAAPLAAEEGVTNMNVSVWVDVDAEGRVSGTKFRSGLHSSIEKLVRNLVESLRFEPARIDDRPVPSRSALMCHLKLTPNGSGGYVVEVTGVDPAGSLPVTSVMPSYPAEALSGGIGGTVVLDLWIDARGRVDIGKTQVTAASIQRNGEPYDGIYKRKLIKAALDAVAKWTFEQPEVDGRSISTRQLLPIRFSPPASGGERPFEYGGLTSDPPAARPTDPARSLGRIIPLEFSGGD